MKEIDGRYSVVGSEGFSMPNTITIVRLSQIKKFKLGYVEKEVSGSYPLGDYTLIKKDRRIIGAVRPKIQLEDLC